MSSKYDAEITVELKNSYHFVTLWPMHSSHIGGDVGVNTYYSPYNYVLDIALNNSNK
jgi:hypothetical protein